MTSSPLLLVKNLNHSYQSEEIENHVLRDVNLSMVEKDFVTILGPSGCGKTTFLNLLGGLERPTSGEIIVSGKNIAGMDSNRLCGYRKEQIAFIFQFYNLFPNLTAGENVMAGIEVLDLPQREISERTKFYLSAVGLEKKIDHLPSHLSGGEQQRVAIARALAKRAPLILADEPTGNLDSESGKIIMDLFQHMNHEHHATILMITHDSAVAQRAHRIIHMLNGTIAKETDNRNSNKEKVNAL